MNENSHCKKLGIITIATGKYFQEFIPTLRASIDQFFVFSGYEIHFYCFTDSTLQVDRVSKFEIKHLGWPFSTLLRYYWIEKELPILTKCDFLLYVDADMKVISTPPESIFDNSLIAVRHPGYLNSNGAFEVDRQDSCYVPPPLRKNYYQGCFWGGKSTDFSELICSLSKQVDHDLGVGNIPIWHDESYLNKYLSTKSCCALSPLYAWPQYEEYDQMPYLLHLDKKHNVIRQTSEGKLNIKNLILGNDSQSDLEIYKKLYLNSHEKCQRLERRLSQENTLISNIREWLAYFKNR